MSELAWAAGFFDGEGHIGIAERNARSGRNLTFAVNQVDRRPLDRFAAALWMPDRVLGPYNMVRGGNLHWKPQHKFQVSSFEKVQAAIAMLWKYLSEPKREQAMAVLKELAYRRANPQKRGPKPKQRTSGGPSAPRHDNSPTQPSRSCALD